MTISRTTLRRWYVPILLLWVLGIGVFQAAHQTLTSDESIHTASAYLALTRIDNRFDPEHPFLFKYLTALPFLVYHTNLPRDDQKLWALAEPTLFDSWRQSRAWADQWVYESGNNPRVMQILMRLPGIAVLVVLTWFSWWLARRWFGDKVANWAILFTALNPTLLAHGFMTNTDVPLVLSFLLAVWRLWEYWEKPTRLNALWVGVTITVALLTKFSGVSLFISAPIWLVVVSIMRKTKWHVAVVDMLIALAAFFVLVWTVYLFHSPIHIASSEITNAQNIIFQYYGRHVSLAGFVNTIPRFLPSAFVKGMVMVLNGGIRGRSVFFLGQNHWTGVWYYFPAMIFLKSQLVAVLLGVITIGLMFPQIIRPKKWSPLTWLWLITIGIFVVLAMKSKINLGIRHISPLMPFLSFIFALTMVRIQPLLRSHLIPTIVVVGYILPVVAQSNNLIGFGNILTYPGQDKHIYFDDSNLDWGQSWQRIGDVLKEHFPNEPVYQQYYSSALHYYAPNNLQADINHAGSEGVGAILLSASDLNDTYARYQQYEPAYIVDDAYFIYQSDKLVPK